MKYLRVLLLVLGLSFSTATVFAQEMPQEKSRTALAGTQNKPSTFMKTDHVGAASLAFMEGKWKEAGKTDFQEIWSFSPDKMEFTCLRTQYKHPEINYDLVVIRQRGTVLMNRTESHLMQTSDDPWHGGMGQDDEHSAEVTLALSSRDGTVQKRESYLYKKQSENSVLLVVTTDSGERKVELERVKDPL